MNNNPVVVDLLINFIGFIISFYIGNYIWKIKKRSVNFSASATLIGLALFYYVAAKYFHMTFLIVVPHGDHWGLSWQHANAYLFCAALASICTLYFYFTKK